MHATRAPLRGSRAPLWPRVQLSPPAHERVCEPLWRRMQLELLSTPEQHSNVPAVLQYLLHLVPFEGVDARIPAQSSTPAFSADPPRAPPPSPCARPPLATRTPGSTLTLKPLRLSPPTLPHLGCMPRRFGWSTWHAAPARRCFPCSLPCLHASLHVLSGPSCAMFTWRGQCTACRCKCMACPQVAAEELGVEVPEEGDTLETLEGLSVNAVCRCAEALCRCSFLSLGVVLQRSLCLKMRCSSLAS